MGSIESTGSSTIFTVEFSRLAEGLLRRFVFIFFLSLNGVEFGETLFWMGVAWGLGEPRSRIFCFGFCLTSWGGLELDWLSGSGSSLRTGRGTKRGNGFVFAATTKDNFFSRTISELRARTGTGKRKSVGWIGESERGGNVT